ncbi:MAG: glycosyl transferase family 2 [Candidatus Thermoplasmatota archaeon]|nr:glycosyl transferase family 2 [Candidatus Thermoplasmatota archaeon]
MNDRDFSLDENVREQLDEVGRVDILVGVLCKNVEATILHVLNTVSDGLHKYFPEYRTAIAVTDGFSEDRTLDLAELFKPHNGIAKVITRDMATGGKGAGVRTVMEIAHELDAKSLVMVDGDLLSIKPTWLQEFSYPVLCGRAELIVPYYIRDKYDGVITNILAYPFTRALYGQDIRQPLAGEFGMSRELYETLRGHPLFPYDFGIDVFIVTTAAAEQMRIREGIYSLKIHESTTRYLEPEELLVPMFRQVTGQMFEMAGFYQDVWRSRCNDGGHHGHKEFFTQNPVPVNLDLEKLTRSFRQEFTEHRDDLHRFLPASHVDRLHGCVDDLDRFDAELWAHSVYSLATAYRQADPSEKKTIIEVMKTLWFGRFVSYAHETADMDMDDAEAVIQHQARVFDDTFEDYMLTPRQP